MALVATFLLLTAGVLVSAPGMMSASASGAPSTTDQVGDNENQNEDENQAEDEHQNEDEDQAEDEDQDEHEVECQVENEHEDDDEDEHQADDEHQDEDEHHDGDDSSGQSSDDDQSSAFSADTVTVTQDTDNDDDSQADDEHQADDENQHENDDENQHENDDENQHENDDDDENQNCDVATLTVFKSIGDDTHGGVLTTDDFQLLVDGAPQAQNVPVDVPAGVHTVSEDQQQGYELRAILCNDDDTNVYFSNYDGVVDLAAGQHVTCNVINDEIAPTITMHKKVVNDDGGSAEPQDFQLVINDDDTIAQDTPYPVTANLINVVSETGAVAGYAPTMIECSSDVPDSPNNFTLSDTGMADVFPVLGENVDCTITNDDVATGLTIVKQLQEDDGGNAVVADFPLQVNGEAVTSGEPVAVPADTALTISETQQPGYVAILISCVSTDPDSSNTFEMGEPLDPTALAIFSVSATEAVVCTITNDDIAPTVTVHKVVVGGPALPGEFQMTVNGNPVDQDVASPTLSNTPIVVSEDPVAGYQQTSVECTDNDANDAPVVHPLLLDEGQNVTCVVTNTFQAATITVTKDVTNDSGGTLGKADFDLTLDDVVVAQDTAVDVEAGTHVIGEVTTPGYAQTSIVCTDAAGVSTVLDGGIVAVDAGQQLACTVSNDDIPATLTVAKQVIANDGGVADPADFQLQIDDADVPQNAAQFVSAGTHTIGEVAVPGWRLTAIICTDDVTKEPVSYSSGILLGLAQHVTCIVFNDDDPIDLAITKTDDGLVKVAGGAAFDYTITVDNLGPRDATSGTAVTVTDQLPVGFDFVAFPTNCSALGQALTCAVDPADLQVADAPVVLTVSVKAHPDIAAGTYTNVAFVDTPEDPACVGTGCVPVCASSNNVACETTDITREASITIDKHDDVVGAINPGMTYNYLITVSNPGPSTFLGGLTVTDDLPAELSLVSVDGGGQWTCAPVDPVVCTFGQNLQPGVTTAAITIRVTLDPNFLGTSVFNQATATATVDPPAAPAQLLRIETTTGAPGTVVTATDDETTTVVRNSDLAVVKSVSQASAAAGAQFNWVLDVTNKGPQAATNVVVSDSIPAAFEVLGAFPGAGLNCTNTTTSVQCTAASMAAGATVQVTIQVRVVAGTPAGTVTNTATVTSDSVDSDPSNNSSSASIDVAASESLAPVPPAQTPPGNTQLPRTGSNSGEPLQLAGMLLIAGALAIYVARRRRSVTAQ